MISHALIKPKSIAVFGASKHAHKPGYGIIQNLKHSPFVGPVFPVNPNETEICGLISYTNLLHLPDTDMAILAIPAGACYDTVQQMAAKKNTKAFVIISAGFSETGDEGLALTLKIRALAEEKHLSILGPNCIGLANKYFTGFFTTPPPQLHPSGIDFVSASGALAVFIFEQAKVQGIRFNEVFTVGNSLQIGVEEVLEYWDITFDAKSSARVKMIYTEQLRDAQKAYRHLHSLTQKGCRIVVSMPGKSKSGAKASLSHTGAMAGDAEAYRLLFEKAGAIICDARTEMVYQAGVCRIAAKLGSNAAIITHAGGPGVLLADALEAADFSLPPLQKSLKQKLKTILHPGASVDNPVDILATGTKEQLRQTLRECDKEAYIDIITVIYGKTGLENLFETYQVLSETIKELNKPVFIVTPSVTEAREETESITRQGQIVFFDEVSLAMALGKLRKPFCSDATELPAPISIKSEKRKLLSPEAAESLLRDTSILIPNQKAVYPVSELSSIENFNTEKAAKVLGLNHKTESGGVVLNIASKEALHAAFEHLTGLPGATGILVQDMVEGVELFIGAKHHPGIGYSVHFGVGGIFVELLNDTVSQLAPVGKVEASLLISRLKSARIFEGYRNIPPVNKELFAELIARFSLIFQLHPNILELDVNPLIANANGFYAVDTRIIVQ